MAKIIFSERVTQHGMVMNHAWRKMGAVEVRGYRLGTIANATCRMWRLNTQALQSLQVTLWSWQINQWDAGKQMSKCSIDLKATALDRSFHHRKTAMPDIKSLKQWIKIAHKSIHVCVFQSWLPWRTEAACLWYVSLICGKTWVWINCQVNIQ